MTEISLQVGQPDHTTIMPAPAGRYEAVVKAPKSAVAAGEPVTQTVPVLAFVIHHYVEEDAGKPTFRHPMQTEPLVFWPVTERDVADGQEWQSGWDTGCAMCPSEANLGRTPDDQYKWKVQVVA